MHAPEANPNGGDEMKRKIPVIIALFCVLLVIAFLAYDEGCVDYEGPAHFDNLSVTVEPPELEKGGKAMVKAALAFRGGCCYPLYVRNLAVSLTASPGIAVSRPNPHVIEEKEALGGGDATMITVTWKIMVDEGFDDKKITVSMNMDGLDAPFDKTVTIGNTSDPDRVSRPRNSAQAPKNTSEPG